MTSRLMLLVLVTVLFVAAWSTDRPTVASAAQLTSMRTVTAVAYRDRRSAATAIHRALAVQQLARAEGFQGDWR